MAMPGRKYQSSNRYRYGYNGKENDPETVGTGSGTQDYGMRIYNPALGKFLSVDPLSKEYSWNSTYAFAENNPIQAVDLDGGEKLKANIASKPINGKPGKAKITIELAYQVVTQGAGAVNGSIDPDKFKSLYSKGNRTMYMTKLPSKDGEAEYLTPGQVKDAKDDIERGVSSQFDYYIVEVQYIFTVSNGTTLEEAIKWKDNDPVSNGIIMTPTNLKSSSDPLVNSIDKLATKVFSAAKGNETGGISLNESTSSVADNVIVLNPGFLGNLTTTEISVHEGGHNVAAENIHGTGSYEYGQKGLQSNTPGSIFPSENNTKAILKDNYNRSKMTTNP
jgi:RHS repeat-associated protein